MYGKYINNWNNCEVKNQVIDCKSSTCYNMWINKMYLSHAILNCYTDYWKYTREAQGKGLLEWVGLSLGSSGNKTEQAVEDEIAVQKGEKVHRKGKAHEDIRTAHSRVLWTTPKELRVPAKIDQDRAVPLGGVIFL